MKVKGKWNSKSKRDVLASILVDHVKHVEKRQMPRNPEKKKGGLYYFCLDRNENLLRVNPELKVWGWIELEEILAKALLFLDN